MTTLAADGEQSEAVRGAWRAADTYVSAIMRGQQPQRPIHFFLPTFCFSTFFLLFRSACHSEPVLYAAPLFRAS